MKIPALLNKLPRRVLRMGLWGLGLVGAFNTFGPKLFYIPLPPALIPAAMALATVAGVVAAAVPASRAARLDPVEAIRHA